ncbi:hypothetical protein F4677DRAFT_422373 [Hypoxylon crocopeplum]|nr:hypothetical protein F4677DRAFT_422373 [Hypoxylon crocopeplum]
MDPLTVLGAAAASFQFAGYAVKGFLRTIALVQDMEDVPKRMSQLLRHIDHELTSVNNLLCPDSPIYVHLSAAQYAQISIPAVEARKAMERIQKFLLSLGEISEDSSKSEGKGKAVVLLWRKLMSVEKEKDIETEMKFLERLNASLLRELQVSGFETQSFLRGQSSCILKRVTASATNTQETRQAIHQVHTLQSQTLDTVQSSTTSLVHGLDVLRLEAIETRESIGQFHTQLSDHQVELLSHFEADNNKLI